MPVNTIDTIVPKNGGSFPVVSDINIQGGIQVQPSTAARDAIPLFNQKVGMLVYVTANSTYYQLSATGTPGTWVAANLGSTASLAGDVTGTNGANSVTKIRGVNVSTNSVANDGYALVSTSGQYVPTGVSPVFNVKNFGAKGDGITDDTIAIDRAIAAAAAATPPGRVYFPGSSTAYIRSVTPLNILSGIEVFGDGAGITTLKQNTVGVDVVTITDVSDSYLHDISIVSNGSAHGIHVKAISNSDMEHPTLERLNISGFGSVGKTVSSVTSNTVNVTAHGFANGDVVMFSAGAQAIFLVNPIFSVSGNLVQINGHGLANGDPVQFNDNASSTLPGGLSAFTTYYVISSATNSFQISATHGGSAIVFTGSGSTYANIVIWPEVPGGLFPYIEYYIISSATNSFQVSLTSGGSAVVLSGIQPASTCKVAKIYAGIVFETAGQNIYSPRVRDCRCNGSSNYWDGGARQGIRSMRGSGGDSVIHGSIIGGECSNLKTGIASPVGEFYVTDTHVYNVLDGSGGGAAFYTNNAGGLNAGQIRFEIPAIERAVVFDINAYQCVVEGLRQFQSFQIIDLGTADSWELGVNGGVINQKAGAWWLQFLYEDTIFEKTAGHGTTLGCASIKSTGATFSSDVHLTGSAAFRSASGFFYNPADNGLALALGTGTFTSFGQVTENNNNVSNRLLDGASNTTTSGGSTAPISFQLPSSSAISVTFTAIARRTGGSRGTGTVGDSAMFIRKACVKMVGANSGTPGIVGSTLTPTADQSDSDLTSAGISVSLDVATDGIVKLTCNGAANLNLTWHVVYEIKPQNSFP